MATVAEAIDEIAGRTGFSGVVRVDEADGSAWSGAYGQADRAHGIANTADTIFGLASGGKGFTALTVASLIDEGTLAFDTTARSILGDDLPLIRDDVTVELLLAQASFIEGHVVTAEGKPAAGAQVMATSGPQEMAVAQASESGSFSLEVSPRTWAVAAKLGDESGRADHPVTVAPGATSRGVKIQLGAACGIAGTVVAAASQQPVANAQIAVSPHNANGDSGRFLERFH